MLKVLKLLSITSLSAPLILISCSQNVQPEISTISIDREKLEQNFAKGIGENNSTFTPESIKAFISDFNTNPQNYFIALVPASSTAIPFITANLNSFLKNESKPIISAEISSNLPSFRSIKFSYKLDSKYKPKVIITNSPSSVLEPLETYAFSMDFRVLIPKINTAERKAEIDWIKTFFNKTSINYASLDIKKATLAKTPTQIAKEITNRIEFEKIFKMIVPFPNKLITGWDYTVSTIVNPDLANSVKFIFTLSNHLFVGADVLTSEESTINLIVEGFAKEKE